LKNIKILLSAAIIGVFTFTAVGCNMITKTDAAIKKSTVAKIGKTVITRGELDKKMEPIISSLQAQGVDINTETGKQTLLAQKKQTLQGMIIDIIVMNKAKENKLIDEAKITQEVQSQYDEIKKSFSTEKEFDDAMKQANFTEQTFKDYLRTDLIKMKVADFITKDVKVTDEDVKKYYDSNQLRFTEKPNTIHVAHILLANEQDANKAKARLDAGEKFETVAKEMSTDTGSKDNGGDLGEVPYVDSGYDLTFMQAALALKDGQISIPIHTQFGYHIIWNKGKKEYAIKSFDSVKADITKTLTDEAKNNKVQTTLDQWQKDAKVVTDKYEKNLM